MVKQNKSKLNSISVVETNSIPRLSLVGCTILFLGLVFSSLRIFMSIGMILIIVDALGFVLRKKYDFKHLGVFLLISGIFFLYLFSGLFLSVLDYCLERVRIKLPFLLLPIAFWILPPLGKKQYFFLLSVFLALLTIASLGVLGYALTDWQAITHAYQSGWVMTTPANHIRFSLMVSFACMIGYYLYQNNFYFFSKKERWLQLGASLFLFLFLHLLAVRSGLLAFYVASFFIVIHYIFTKRKWLQGSLLLIGIALLPFLSYYTIPTLNNKINYAIYDVQKYFNGEDVSHLSDSRRLLSWEVGIKVAAHSPLCGVGVGNVKKEVQHLYATEFPHLTKINWIMPHNQYIFVYASMGLIGLLIFGICIFGPVFYKFYFFKDVLFGVFNIIIWSSFLSECTLEGQLGVAFYTIFLLLGLSFLNGQSNSG